MRSTVRQRNSSNTRWHHLLQTLEMFRSSGRYRQEKIPKSSSSGRESWETPGKFSWFSLGLWTITKSLSLTLLFSHFCGGLCGWLRFKSSSWGMFPLSTSSFFRAGTPMPESHSEVLLEPHPHVKLLVMSLLWSDISWRCFLCVVSAGSGVLNVCINCRGAHLLDSRFGAWWNCEVEN